MNRLRVNWGNARLVQSSSPVPPGPLHRALFPVKTQTNRNGYRVGHRKSKRQRANLLMSWLRKVTIKDERCSGLNAFYRSAPAG